MCWSCRSCQSCFCCCVVCLLAIIGWYWGKFKFLTFILPRIGRKKLIHVKKRPGTDLTLSRAYDKLWEMVQHELVTNHYHTLSIVTVEMPIDQLVPTFIMCPFVTRLGSDAESALKGIVSQKNMVLLVFRLMAPNIQLKELESKDVLVDEKHKDLGDIVDLVIYSTVNGFVVDSQRNSQAVTQICNFIMTIDRGKIRRFRSKFN